MYFYIRYQKINDRDYKHVHMAPLERPTEYGVAGVVCYKVLSKTSWVTQLSFGTFAAHHYTHFLIFLINETNR